MDNVTKEWLFDVEKATRFIINDTKKWFEKNFPEGNAVIGISGGKDSTVTAKILCEAIGKERVIGVLMPNGEQKDISDSYRVCELLGIEHYEINISGAFNSIIKEMHKYSEISQQTVLNLPPRLRMTTLFAVAQTHNGVVINTGNYSEYMLGWFTFGSDTCGSWAPLLDYTCTEVVQIGLYLGLPEDLIVKVPSDGLCGESDEDKFGFSYADCDRCLRFVTKPTDPIYKKVINKVKQDINILLDIIKNERRISREEEIRLHGKPINRTIIARNKKAYTRKYKHKRLNEIQ